MGRSSRGLRSRTMFGLLSRLFAPLNAVLQKLPMYASPGTAQEAGKGYNYLNNVRPVHLMPQHLENFLQNYSMNTGSILQRRFMHVGKGPDATQGTPKSMYAD